jgi:hypothetical protein
VDLLIATIVYRGVKRLFRNRLFVAPTGTGILFPLSKAAMLMLPNVTGPRDEIFRFHENYSRSTFHSFFA